MCFLKPLISPRMLASSYRETIILVWRTYSLRLSFITFFSFHSSISISYLFLSFSIKLLLFVFLFLSLLSRLC